MGIFTSLDDDDSIWDVNLLLNLAFDGKTAARVPPPSSALVPKTSHTWMLEA